MQGNRVSLVLSLVLAIGLCTAASAQRTGGVQSMKLLTPEVGWAATPNQVFWTRDSGHHWRDITPTFRETEVASVFFLSNSSGWVLSTRRNETTNEVAGFDLAYTGNAGASWTLIPVKVPGLNPEAPFPATPAWTFSILFTAGSILEG